MRRQLVLGALPVALLGFVVGYVRMIGAERRAKRSGGSPSRPRVWWWTFGLGLVGLLGGAVIALLSGLADGSHDLAASAMTGTIFLAPGLLVGLAVGIGRWLASRTIWRGRAKGLS